MAIPPDCGRVGKACCPNSYHTGFNPPPKGGYMCLGGTAYSDAAFCNTRTSERQAASRARHGVGWGAPIRRLEDLRRARMAWGRDGGCRCGRGRHCRVA